MNSSTSSFERGSRPLWITLGGLVLVNAVVASLPPGLYERMFVSAVRVVEEEEGPAAELLLFGDSRATRIHRDLFERVTLSLAAPNCTVAFSKLVHDQLLARTTVRPRAVVVFVGANNYNENGIFTRPGRRRAALGGCRGPARYGPSLRRLALRLRWSVCPSVPRVRSAYGAALSERTFRHASRKRVVSIGRRHPRNASASARG